MILILILFFILSFLGRFAEVTVETSEIEVDWRNQPLSVTDDSQSRGVELDLQVYINIYIYI